MRVFVAIDIDEQIRAGLAELQRSMKSKLDNNVRGVRWVRPDSIHLTLKFLGEIKDQQSVEVCRIVKAVAEKCEDFELDVESVGSFGSKSARVLWIGAGKGLEDLKKLQKTLEDALVEAGWEPEKREFAGHLTVCRIKDSRAGYELAKISEDYRDFKAGRLAVGSIVVYQSELTRSGPIYTALGRYDLKKGKRQ